MGVRGGWRAAAKVLHAAADDMADLTSENNADHTAMRVDSIQASGPVSDHQPRGNAHAYGLVRKLEDGSFKGASLEKHLVRFADRLTPAEEIQEEELTIPAEEEEAAQVDAELETSLPSFSGLGEHVNIFA